MAILTIWYRTERSGVSVTSLRAMVGGRVVFNTRAKLLSFAILEQRRLCACSLKDFHGSADCATSLASQNGGTGRAVRRQRQWRSMWRLLQPCMQREHQRRSPSHQCLPCHGRWWCASHQLPRTSVGVHPASSCRDRSTVPVVKYIACAPNRIFRASGGLYRASACCGCGDSSSCAVSAASVVVYIATLLAEFWELA